MHMMRITATAATLSVTWLHCAKMAEQTELLIGVFVAQ